MADEPRDIRWIAGDSAPLNQPPELRRLAPDVLQLGVGRSEVHRLEREANCTGAMRIRVGCHSLKRLQCRPPFAEKHRRPTGPESTFRVIVCDRGDAPRCLIREAEFANRAKRSCADRRGRVAEPGTTVEPRVDAMHCAGRHSRQPPQRILVPKEVAHHAFQMATLYPTERGEQAVDGRRSVVAKTENPVEGADDARLLEGSNDDCEARTERRVLELGVEDSPPRLAGDSQTVKMCEQTIVQTVEARKPHAR